MLVNRCNARYNTSMNTYEALKRIILSSKELTLIFKIVLGLFIIRIIGLYFKILKSRKIKRQILKLANNSIEMTPKSFMELRKNAMKKKDHKCNYSGVYIIYNKSKDMYYIGQATRVLDRLNQHFTGHGNGDVYADFKYGDNFSIRTIALKNSNCKSLNELERKTIKTYDAYSKGYNRTRGNKG